MTSQISKTKRKRILERDNYKCQICGREVIDDGININALNYCNLDHIIPKSKGGKNGYDNLRVTCKSCNCLKGNRNFNEILKQILKPLIIEKYRFVIDDQIKLGGNKALTTYIENLINYKNYINCLIENEIKRYIGDE